MQSHNPTEPSEEVRLKLVQLLTLIMDQAGSAIAAYASEVWSMLTALLVDSFHEVAVLGCTASEQLAGMDNTYSLFCYVALPMQLHYRPAVDAPVQPFAWQSEIRWQQQQLNLHQLLCLLTPTCGLTVHLCVCVILYAPSATLGLRLGATSKELVAALLPLTTHKRYRVRIAAVEAIRDVMHQVGTLAQVQSLDLLQSTTP